MHMYIYSSVQLSPEHLYMCAIVYICMNVHVGRTVLYIVCGVVEGVRHVL